MSSTFQPQQLQPQQVQPVVVYPNNNDPITNQPMSTHHRHSDGSFGTVFIVLAVITVVSAIACLLGRLCNRRISGGHVSQKHHHNNNNNNKSKSAKGNVNNNKNQSRVNESAARAKEQPPPPPHHGGGGDIEFGFDKLRSSSTAPPKGNIKPPVINGNINGVRPAGSRGHVAFERNGNHATAKHHGSNGNGNGGGGGGHDYHGGPRASD